MFRTLLTPLVSKFDLSPRLSPRAPKRESDELAPEDFARDVLIELMRNAVENLKQVDDLKTRAEVLSEIHRIMLQDARTKDVFRELDGFLLLMSTLSTTHPSQVPDPGYTLANGINDVRLVFVVASEAMYSHPENTDHFNTSVGYENLERAIQTFVSDRATTGETLGFILSFALHDFSLSGFFVSLRQAGKDAVDQMLSDFSPRLGTILHPSALFLLQKLTHDSGEMEFIFIKLLELLTSKNHRNKAVLSTRETIRPLLNRFLEWESQDDRIVDRIVVQKLLRRLLDMGSSSLEARQLFRRAIKEDNSLDMEILELIRVAMKSRWLEHFSFHSRVAMIHSQDDIKGMPATGFTFMMWLWIEHLPTNGDSFSLFTVRTSTTRALIQFKLRKDGKLEFSSTGNRNSAIFEKARISKGRWTHITLVHYPVRDRSSNSTIRLFLDGILIDVLNWYYPKADSYTTEPGRYIIGDSEDGARMDWSMASAYFLSAPLADDIPRFIHHLGPRYLGHFQDCSLSKFLTYEASTSLNMFLAAIASMQKPKTTTPGGTTQPLSMLKTVQEGLGLQESQIIFCLTPLNCSSPGTVSTITTRVGSGTTTVQKEFKVQGDAHVVKVECLDMTLWKLGGTAVTLRLVQLADTPHELSRALSIFNDGIRNSWRNSEDVEQLRGYEILGDILRSKSQIINMTSFETLFEFFGISFRSPEQSTIVNIVAYRVLAVDFELWAHARKDIQRVHLEHFRTLMVESRHRNFNIKQRLAKLGLVRRLLFVLQTDWYQHDSLVFVVDALKVAAETSFTKDEAIKPIVSYLAANLHGDIAYVPSPQSIYSRVDYKDNREKAEQVLEMLVSILSNPPAYAKFAAALPVTRICLLLLGDKPSAIVASQVLLLIAISISTASSFPRKFELVSGWSTLRTILPTCWDPSVNEAAFDVLLGNIQADGKKKATAAEKVVICPHIMPSILSALKAGLKTVARNCSETSGGEVSSWSTESTMEVLIEEIMDLHSSSPTFRQTFQSQQTTQILVDAYKSFVQELELLPQLNERVVRMLEKLSHLGLALALDNAVAGAQKREILDTLQAAENLTNPAAEKTEIDPGLVTDTRSIRQRIASARFSLQVGERTVIKIITRMTDWRKTIQVSERKRLRKNLLDLHENRRQVSRLQDWTRDLIAERGLWPDPGHSSPLWRLDETEGPQRIRKKMEPTYNEILNTGIEQQQVTRKIELPETDDASVVHSEVPPWAESYEISSTEIEDRQLAEDIADDKHRRVRHELAPGDVIEAVATVARIVGVDSSPGLLIIGKTHIYMLDGLVESEDGEVIDAHEAPKSLFFVPGSIVELDGPQRAQRWEHDQIVTFSNKTFLFRDVALEIYFKDSRSLLMVFLDKKRRSAVDHHLSGVVSKPEPVHTPGILRTPLIGKVSARVLSGFLPDELSTAQRKWQAREISNFTYLSILNQMSGRTPNDATQYPVFPWVLQDYTSKTLDLSDPSVYRDLSTPMGALTEARRDAAEARYSNLQSVEEKPFHYGTHFSSSMIVCHFLIRMAPFTNMFKTLQGGDWDLPDRLFVDVARAYDSAAHDVRSDVRELIPEFYTCPEFLENYMDLDFGVQQNTGEKINHVKLPPWAREDPLLFVAMNRKALESDHVSEHLPQWIDLIWGCKQRDPDSLNVFHPLSYEGSIDLDSITDELEREATVGIIHNFGQTPRKLFNSPHPQRYNHGISSLPIGTLHGIEEDPHLLVQGNRVLKDLGLNVPVGELVLDMIGERVIPCPRGMLSAPSYPHERIEWGPSHSGGDLRVLVDQKLIQVVEGVSCTCAAFADSHNLVTGSSDYTVRMWTLSRSMRTGTASLNVALSHILRIHTDEVTCVAASRPWAVAVSGSRDGSAAIWDLNRAVYIRSIWHGEDGDLTAINLAAINESTGYIATCSRVKLCLHTINARAMAVLDLTKLPSYSTLHPTITSLSFHEREYSNLGILATGGSDGSITLRTWTADGTPVGEKAQWEFLTVRTMKVRAPIGHDATGKLPTITALRFIGESLCHGEDTGKSYMWTLPD